MIYNKENILLQSDFTTLSERVELLYKIAKSEHCSMEINDDYLTAEQGRYYKGITVQSCKRVRYWTNNEDAILETVKFFGKSIEPALDALKKHLHYIGHKNIKCSNIWLQYGDSDTRMERHTDGTIRGATYENCYTSLFFTHKYWDENWGGIFKVTDVPKTMQEEIEIVPYSFIPKPNSFVIWNRNHPHWMTPIIKGCPLRMFLGMSWYE